MIYLLVYLFYTLILLFYLILAIKLLQIIDWRKFYRYNSIAKHVKTSQKGLYDVCENEFQKLTEVPLMARKPIDSDLSNKNLLNPPRINEFQDIYKPQSLMNMKPEIAIHETQQNSEAVRASIRDSEQRKLASLIEKLKQKNFELKCLTMKNQ